MLEAIQRKFLRLVGMRQGVRFGRCHLLNYRASFSFRIFRQELISSAGVTYNAPPPNGLPNYINVQASLAMLLSQMDYLTTSISRSLDLFGMRHLQCSSPKWISEQHQGLGHMICSAGRVQRLSQDNRIKQRRAWLLLGWENRRVILSLQAARLPDHWWFGSHL
ncbi:hypothetical protein J6590_059522 [Homalodisca vitripennis]|nr:hypothetical protein J6590_059522 [Homalodisca vitripennis]